MVKKRTSMAPDQKSKAIVIGIRGTELSKEEIQILKDYKPVGVILFRYNIVNDEEDSKIPEKERVNVIKERVKKLCNQIKKHLDAQQRPCIWIDHEGLAVSRFWLRAPSNDDSSKSVRQELFPFEIRDASYYREEYEAAKGDKNKIKKVNSKLTKEWSSIAGFFKEIGIDVVCAPVLDVYHPECVTKDLDKSVTSVHKMDKRSYGATPEAVKIPAELICKTLKNHNLISIVKHAPGIGSSGGDTHQEEGTLLPRSEIEKEVELFGSFTDKTPICMMSHCVQRDIDPANSFSLSKEGIKSFREKNNMKNVWFVTDDVCMGGTSMNGEPLSVVDNPANVKEYFNAGNDIVICSRVEIDRLKSILDNAPYIPSSFLENQGQRSLLKNNENEATSKKKEKLLQETKSSKKPNFDEVELFEATGPVDFNKAVIVELKPTTINSEHSVRAKRSTRSNHNKTRVNSQAKKSGPTRKKAQSADTKQANPALMEPSSSDADRVDAAQIKEDKRNNSVGVDLNVCHFMKDAVKDSGNIQQDFKEDNMLEKVTRITGNVLTTGRNTLGYVGGLLVNIFSPTFKEKERSESESVEDENAQSLCFSDALEVEDLFDELVGPSKDKSKKQEKIEDERVATFTLGDPKKPIGFDETDHLSNKKGSEKQENEKDVDSSKEATPDLLKMKSNCEESSKETNSCSDKEIHFSIQIEHEANNEAVEKEHKAPNTNIKCADAQQELHHDASVTL